VLAEAFGSLSPPLAVTAAPAAAARMKVRRSSLVMGSPSLGPAIHEADPHRC